MSLLLRTTRSVFECFNRISLRSCIYPKFNPVKYRHRTLSVFTEFKLPNNISSDIENHSISPDKKHLTISWNADNTQTNEFYSLWLRLLTPDNQTDNASDGIDGGTGCNFIFLLSRLLHSRPVLISVD